MNWTLLPDAPLKTLQGQSASLTNYQGKVLLIVNVASKCGLTPQYDALEKLYREYQGQGFEILGFPCNDFGQQEPGTPEEIQEFCRSNFGVKFPLFEKISVKGPDQHPLYHFLTEALPSAIENPGPSFEEKLKAYGITRSNPKDILWNFEKFLISREGKPLARFAPDVTPDSPLIQNVLQKALQES